MWDIPKDKAFPPDAAQCDQCGGHGCDHCQDRGWVSRTDPKARKCLREACPTLLDPRSIAVYCSAQCAWDDA